MHTPHLRKKAKQNTMGNVMSNLVNELLGRVYYQGEEPCY